MYKKFAEMPEPFQHEIPTGLIVEVLENGRIRVGIQSPAFNASVDMTPENAAWAVELLQSAIRMVKKPG